MNNNQVVNRHLAITVYRPTNPDDPARFLLDGQHIGLFEVVELIVERLNEVNGLVKNEPLASQDVAKKPTPTAPTSVNREEE